MDYYKNIPILDADEPAHVVSIGDGMKGLVPRDYSEYPQQFMGSPDELEVIPKSEWDSRFDEQEAEESSLEHLFLRGGKPAFVNLDQNGDGHCWAYSSTHALMLTRLRDLGAKNVGRLNPHFVAAYLKRFDGGWCGASGKVLVEVGVPQVGTKADQWPLHSNDSSRITAAVLAGAAKYKTTEEWRDLTKQVYDQSMNSLQLATCGFLNVPAPSDFNWWGHSVCQVRWVRIEKGSWGPLILNSWSNWGRFGLAVLRGSQAIANGAIAVRTSTPTMAA